MKVKKVIGRSLLVLLCIVVVIAIIGIAQFHHRSNPKNLKQYETNTAAARASTRRRRWRRSAAVRKTRMCRWIISSSTCI